MADSKASELQEKLRLLGASYAAQLPEKIQQIDAAWEALLQAWDEETLQTLHRMAHSLAGSGATFGFSDISKAARALEQTLKDVESQKTPANSAQRETVVRQKDELRRAALSAAQAPAAEPSIIEEKASRSSLRAANSKQIFIVDDDNDVAQELALQLENFGYKVKVFSRLAEFVEAAKQSHNAVVLMDIEFPGDILGGASAISELQQCCDTLIPILFISAHTRLAARLAAVRAGGVGYFTKPVNIGSLIDKLDELMSATPQQPYRVLAVDDEESVSAYHAAILEQAGVVVKAVSHPMRVMEALFEFEPDMILMDVYMPECNGLELAKVIRQMDTFVSTPIVYLSSESDLDKQFSAMSLGGDEFLLKPIQPQHLVSTVMSRIQRARLLRSFMVRDSLTGLLNHTAVKEQLDREVARARRSKTPLSFAMVDIDHFKRVNDTYGHPAGDRVIKSLSRLLKQRLREADVIGRYGGEEFAVIMSDTDGEAAVRVLDEIRYSFSMLRQVSDGKEFSATFSCGVAELAGIEDEVKLGDAADKALYQAKHAGRNRVVLAQRPA